jgi:uncharacterized protein YkwD
VNHSPKPFIAALSALLLLLAGGVTAAPVLASSTARIHHHATPRRKTARHRGPRTARHAHKGCRRGSGCSGHTGGTPASPTHAKTPRTVRREQVSPKRLVKPAAPSPRAAAEKTAAVIAAVLASPCANTELTPSAENQALVRTAVLCLINHERAEHGLNPLAISARLESAAEGHCAELISANYFAHVSPNGETPVDRIRNTGYIPGPSVGYVIGENLAWGTYSLSTPQSVVSAWLASPGHLANILESQYTETGIGIVPAVPVSVGGGSPGASYAQEFGVIVH